jgi:hypothetical protein
MRRWMVAAIAGIVLAPSAQAAQEKAAPLGALARMPVKEITVFKDGHAFVLHEGRLPRDANGNVQMDYIPVPVIGTFWPYSADPNVKLTAVTASPRRVAVKRTALTVRELIEANSGAQVGIQETDGKGYGAQIVGIPERSSAEQEETSPPNADEKLPQKADIVLLKTAEGIASVPLERIRTVTFKGEYNKTVVQEEFRNLLTLKLNGGAAGPASVGMLYLQKGVRWIPSYKVSIDGKGNAVVKLQATLINEMTDLQDVTANLVIGVPTFYFKETIDPIGAQQTMAQLSQYFQTDVRSGFAMSNALMTQAGRAGERGGFGGGAAGPAGQPPDLGPEVAGSDKSEDLFVFSVKHVTLKKGERMVLPVTEFPLKYKDVYTLDIPFAPPRDIRANINTDQQAELARLMAQPKAMHKLRLSNKSTYPLTTAPALILSGDRLLAQGMMTYTPIGSDTDLAITTAVDIKVKKSEKEAARTPNAVEWQGNRYGRVDMAGTISLTNYRNQPVSIEVTRHVLGHADKADHDGQVTMLNQFEDDEFAAPMDYPYWWRWYSWPHWWYHFNGTGRFDWKVELPAGKSVDLGYTWHYFWQ